MNMRRAFFVGLFLLSAMPVATFAARESADAKRSMMQNAMVQQFLSSSLGSLAIGGSVGAVTGSIANFLQNKVERYLNIQSEGLRLFLTFASYTLMSDAYNSILANVQSNLDQDEITYNSNLMSNSALVAAILTYFNL